MGGSGRPPLRLEGAWTPSQPRRLPGVRHTPGAGVAPLDTAIRSRALTTAHFLRRWGVSFASLCGGLATLFVFRRGLPHVGWIIGYLLLAWLLVILLALVREAWQARGWKLPVRGADYAVQTLLHGVLLFILPAYYASTTLSSLNAIFLGLLVAQAFLATVDPWFVALVQPWTWARHGFFFVAMFAALNVALPLVGVSPYPSLMTSATVAVLAFTPLIQRGWAMPWPRALRVTLGAAVVMATLATLVRWAIPPAPLALAGAAIARGIADWEPIDQVIGPITAAQLREWAGLVAYTAIYAPAGLSQAVEHVWRLEGRAVSVIRLSPVRGGRREGFRTYSRKTSFPSNPAGRWSVDVVTTSGQLIGRLRFQVLP
jgi:Family of unknown function (DUF5924)/Protein of unknown function (DUF2914)